MDTQALANLRDIHMPAPIGFWPVAIGWYALAFLILCGLVYFSLRTLKRYRRKQHLNLALAKLTEIHAYSDKNPNYAVQSLAILLRKFSLLHYQREQISSLQGEKWLQFLDETGNTRDFTQGIGRSLLTAPYQRHVQIDINGLIVVVEKWLRNTA